MIPSHEITYILFPNKKVDILGVPNMYYMSRSLKLSILGESSNFFNCDFVTAASKTAAACGAVSKINLLRVLPAEQNIPRKNTIGTRCHQHHSLNMMLASNISNK